ncbi:MAG: FmdE family protein [Pseudodesulfovibrio sp.]|jgi:formylmethanofuran dehydrogenase subunit E|uniref:Formylmethanofuran dehydrogenase n=1 Tax=Pseudodesulfovibrio indicus TaxID=1716143 RepID=A0A126QRH4_9BACT|nr:FmdE family protein [Pseudodesulfovibrio indicus]AMK12660.1 formylmethanofuran dehydrogenase [Pseudodesulfovibrio indicus]TDT90975.1 formylmethanofuran dehydrogenase subunit E [Pseudodesulfovibrio indicus]
MPCTLPKEKLDETIRFHGHHCPGLTIGIRAVELAERELGDLAQTDLVAVSETDMCGVDAIQFLTDCTLGKGNFIHRDYGKRAFSFYDRKSGKGFRALLKDLAPGDRSREQAIDHFMTIDLDDMFDLTPLDALAPRPAQVLESLRCEHCGEMTMESRTRRFAGKTYCIPCFSDIDQKL